MALFCLLVAQVATQQSSAIFYTNTKLCKTVLPVCAMKTVTWDCLIAVVHSVLYICVQYHEGSEVSTGILFLRLGLTLCVVNRDPKWFSVPDWSSDLKNPPGKLIDADPCWLLRPLIAWLGAGSFPKQLPGGIGTVLKLNSLFRKLGFYNILFFW